uniref:Acyltransferase 3 domain-containing protein n=1 Tax=Euplotes crassus TaxID=5936 RepID=A0A7S3KW64_EUPCR|mmetsp:Transcript_8921/g.8477  ORF Transcript_8921/g.8477 Transcript_8921/m.8477 type:complete len:469 (+) Transcript_8921:642-2048(+)
MFWTPQRGDDFLSVLNGLRVISMAYIIFGHIHESMQGLPIINPEEAPNLISSWYGVFVMGGFYSVDTFFFLSAFLGAYLMTPKLMKINVFNFIMIYIHRFIRIIPTLALYIAMLLTFVNFMGSGPIWYTVNVFLVQSCKKYWWTVLTFSNNFYPGTSDIGCIGVLWYISNDMMFFIFLPFVVFAYCRNKFIGYVLTSGLVMANMIIVFVLSAVHNHPMTVTKDKNSTEIYHKPYSRFGAYFVGCLFGFLYYEWKKSKTTPEYQGTLGAIFFSFAESRRAVRLAFHFIGTGIVLFLVMITYTETKEPGDVIVWPQIASNFFNAFHRPLFVIGLALFLVGPIVGKSRFLRFVLGGSAWAPWAKITFIVYLIHTTLIIWFYCQVRQALYMTTRVAVFYWFACFLLSYLIAIPITLLIESPILQLEKLLLFATPPRKTNLQKIEEELDAKVGLLTPDQIHNKESKMNDTKAD